MKLRKFNGFDKNKNLPPGVYNMTLSEVEELFSKNKSEMRNNILTEYKKHLKEIKNTGYCLEHWIDGSFVTLKENPNDIDTLTEFDGIKIDESNNRNFVDNLIKNSKENTNNLCHSLKVYKYPPEQKEDYIRYINQKRRILFKLFGKDRKNNKKGFVRLIGCD